MHLQRGHRHTRLQRENRQEKTEGETTAEREREHAERERVTERERERQRERARERERSIGCKPFRTHCDSVFPLAFFATLLPPTMQRLSFRKVLFLSTANAEASKRKWCHKILAIWS